MKIVRRLVRIGFSISLLSLVVLIASYRVVEKSTKGKVFSSIEEIPHNKVGLLLGTSKKLVNGNINLYYKYRIDAAVNLFKAGKIDYILVSGDNSTKCYNEPVTIKNDLIAQGVPKDRIYLDYAGFRTLDSVVRCKEVFGQERITVISQQFHNERAIYIAKRKKIMAVGYNAKDVSASYGFRTRLRERFARVKMMLDLLLGKKPKFLGEKIEIN